MRLLLFDIDGTLIAAKGAGRRALEQALEVHYGIRDGLASVPLDGKTDPLIVREALEIGKQPFRGLDSEFVRTYLERLHKELDQCHDFAVLEGVVELLRDLASDRGLLIGLATGNIQEGAWMKVRRAGLAHFFRFGGFGCDGENRTEVIRTAIQRGTEMASGPVSDTIVIGDTPRDIQHAREAGARVLAVATGSYDTESLGKFRPDLNVTSLRPSKALLDFLRGSRH